LNPVAVLGGGERSLLTLLSSLRQANPAVEAHLVIGEEGPLADRARALQVAVTILKLPPALAALGDSGLGRAPSWGRSLRWGVRGIAAGWGAWRYARLLRRTVRQLAPEVVHSNGIKFHLLTGLARLRDVPVVWHIRDFLSERRVVAEVLRRLASGCRGAVANSRAVADDARTVIPTIPVETIYNGVDTDEFVPGPADTQLLDHLAGLPDTGGPLIRIGLVAAYARWKGHDVFLDAAARLVRGGYDPPVRFYIVGGPIYQTRDSQFTEAELRARIAHLGLNGHVGLIAFQDRTAPIYRALDVVVHASTRPEPFGLTIAEAMACGRPVVVAAAGGARELFTAEHDAVAVPPGDNRALADALRRLIDAPELRQALATAARQTAVRQFDSARIGPQLLAYYRRLLGNSGGLSARTPGAPQTAGLPR
jgi:glycosyltransferase involved in cell wall biosynthesis